MEDRSVVRGGRRWTDLPHPAPVSPAPPTIVHVVSAPCGSLPRVIVMSTADSREAEVGATQSRQPHPLHSDRGGKDILIGQPGQLLAVAAMHHLLVSQSAVLYTNIHTLK